METPKVETDVTLRLERQIAAPPERVFAAWTQAEGLTRWFGPTQEHSVRVHELDVRVGGRYRLEMLHSSGRSSVVFGTYQEITPPRRLVFTWMWENENLKAETLVTVLVEPEGKGSRLVVLHERFSNTEEREKHNQGWTGCLDRLEASVR